MKKKNNIEKEIHKAEDKVEQIELNEIQEDYKKNVPALIWILKIMLILGLIYDILFLLPKGYYYSIISIAIYSIFLFALIKRKRWGWYFGLILFSIQVIIPLMMLKNIGIIYFIYWIFPLFLFFIHNDYLNQ